ncbi:hypothetical protein [Pseudomonas oryzihabitans]|uniref:Uncharacterized protein n=1 Tax=Pseudomonas oryzihabitans TaxID=47885 RepID=A0AAJ2EWN7_9PSED|nr:hypothetical protein [Pseudomonas psychrotolerans]MDR6233576.1 hypothetical protein [Pseudomonas psychrotolerans]MDR6357376.1 hypothetical protein [Pseudomonas psychrotolerans]
MTKYHSKDRTTESTVTIEAALQKIAASGLKERFMQQDRTGAYEAELAMEHSNFARSKKPVCEDDTE